MDEVLRQRMSEVGIVSWKSLWQKAGISRQVLQHCRHGSVHKLRWSQIQALATALHWSPETLLEHLGILDPAPDHEELRQECLRLRQQILEQRTQELRNWQQQTFRHLQMLLTSYPTACQRALENSDLPAKNLVSIFRPLDTLMANWGIEQIGHPLAATPFSPQEHQGDAPDLVVGDPVYIRSVGYRQGKEILCPAKVSRTLPGGKA